VSFSGRALASHIEGPGFGKKKGVGEKEGITSLPDH
jgi:hypothetical protein